MVSVRAESFPYLRHNHIRHVLRANVQFLHIVRIEYLDIMLEIILDALKPKRWNYANIELFRVYLRRKYLEPSKCRKPLRHPS